MGRIVSIPGRGHKINATNREIVSSATMTGSLINVLNVSGERGALTGLYCGSDPAVSGPMTICQFEVTVDGGAAVLIGSASTTLFGSGGTRQGLLCGRFWIPYNYSILVRAYGYTGGSTSVWVSRLPEGVPGFSRASEDRDPVVSDRSQFGRFGSALTQTGAYYSTLGAGTYTPINISGAGVAHIVTACLSTGATANCLCRVKIDGTTYCEEYIQPTWSANIPMVCDLPFSSSLVIDFIFTGSTQTLNFYNAWAMYHLEG